MLKFRRLDVIVAEVGSAPDLPARVLVSWELVTQHSGLELTSFVVERSLSPKFAADETEGIGIVAGVKGQLIYEYVDVTPNLISFWRLYFYRVKAGTVDGPVYSETRTFETRPRPHELAIVERHDYVLKYLQGEPSFAFIERTADSARCLCWDATASRGTNSKCTLCLGTGRQRPYFEPIKFYVDYNPDEKAIQMSEFGEMEPKQKDCWFSAFPILKPGDIIYQIVGGHLWRIAKLNTVQPQGTTIQQLARLGSIDRTDVEYRRLTQQVSPELLVETVREWEKIKEERLF